MNRTFTLVFLLAIKRGDLIVPLVDAPTTTNLQHFAHVFFLSKIPFGVIVTILSQP